MPINKYTISRLNLTLEGIGMDRLIRKTLNEIDWESSSTKEDLIEAFLHYVDQGCFKGLTLEEAEDMLQDEEITVEQICRNLMKVS
jgi:hypothetical protein